MLALCKKLNVPIKLSKVEGPITVLTFLGILLNATSIEASITSERKEALSQELFSLLQELFSLLQELSLGKDA